jgi:hypothetical protein
MTAEVYAQSITSCPRCDFDCTEALAAGDGPLGWGTYMYLSCAGCGLEVLHLAPMLDGWERVYRERSREKEMVA